MKTCLFSIFCFLFSIFYFPLHAQGPASVTEGEIVYTVLYTSEFTFPQQDEERKGGRGSKDLTTNKTADTSEQFTMHMRMKFKDHLAVLTYEYADSELIWFDNALGVLDMKYIIDSKEKTSWHLLSHGTEKYVVEVSKAKTDSMMAEYESTVELMDSMRQSFDEEMMNSDSFWVEGELVDMNWDSLEQTEEYEEGNPEYGDLFSNASFLPFELTGVTDTINGYVCQQYEGGSPMYSIKIYTSTEFCVPSSVLRYSMIQGFDDDFDFSAVEGCPLKYEMYFDFMGAKLGWILTASEINLKPISSEEFRIPDDYKRISIQELLEGDF